MLYGLYVFVPAWVCPRGSSPPKTPTRRALRRLTVVAAGGRAPSDKEKEIQQSQDKQGLVSEYKTEYLIALVALILLGTVFNPFQ
eukprot:s111_g30.t1